MFDDVATTPLQQAFLESKVQNTFKGLIDSRDVGWLVDWLFNAMSTQNNDAVFNLF